MSNAMIRHGYKLILAVVFIAVSAGAQAQLDPGWKIVVREEMKPDLQRGVTAYQKNDYQVALKEFESLAAKGDAMAQFYLGRMYMQGLGIKPDYNKAIILTRKAAQRGVPEAQDILGFLYYYGLGVKQSYEEAASWIRKAADHGLSEAQNNLGWLYEKGQGVPQDWMQAYVWFKLAEASGESGAVLRMKAAESNLTPKQIEEAEVLAKEWLAKHK